MDRLGRVQGRESFMSEVQHLFSPLQQRGVVFSNRVVMSPMCEYSCEDGFSNDWHFVHLGSRAVGGAGLVVTEATAVTPEGRISPEDLGLWSDAHVPGLQRIVAFLHGQGSRAGIQLAHAGRKASTAKPSDGGKMLLPEQGGWSNVLAPSAIRFADDYPQPQALDLPGIRRIVEAFRAAAARALDANFDLIEIHAAHGYLLHEFLSPLSNRRTDEYGGSLENRMRALLEVVDAVRGAWPEDRPLWVRISATDWVEGGWDIEQSVELARVLKHRGVDLIDVSSGALTADAKIPSGPGYQTPFAEQIRREAGIATGAVGMITDAAQAETIIRTGQADCVLLARAFLRDPYWALHAAEELGQTVTWPVQYLRAAPSRVPMRQPIEALPAHEATQV
jgi:2,4-dienoyl-CoA reductase-like NADH-dependent reductase (Old Yellow Enzyme family)